MNSSDIKLIQRSLKETVTPEIKVDGEWGNITANAVNAYAKAFGVTDSQALIDLLRYGNTRFVTDAAFTQAATVLGVPESYVRAIAEVESSGDSFLKDGRVKILFERHKFFKYLKESLTINLNTRINVAASLGLPNVSSANTLIDAVLKGYPNLCNPVAGGYIGGEGEWHRLNTAMTLDIQAACMSASYGGYQLMGFNYAYCNYTSAKEMLLDMAVSESAQFLAAVNFIKANATMHKALKTADWATFARSYNGSNYAEKGYHLKLAAAELKWRTKK